MLVEYLVIIKKPGSFCDSVGAFLTLLQTDSRITVAGETVQLDGDTVCNLQVTTGDVPAQDQRYFHLKFTWDGDPDANPAEVKKFLELLGAVRTGTERVRGETEHLRNDLSSHYARQAFPLIQEIENTMRRLITNFMMVNVGLNWSEETLPPDVGKAVQATKKRDVAEEHADKQNLNVLYKVDFDDLGKLLFDPYTLKTVQELYKYLDSVEKTEKKDIETYLPRSNWQRYFSSVINCDDAFLKLRWGKLYSLRCKVAHNALMTAHDLESIKKLSGEVLPILKQALDSLPQVSVPKEEVEAVAENAASTTSAVVGEFILKWQGLEGTIANLLGPEYRNRPIPPGTKLLELGFLTTENVRLYDATRHLRNQTVHARGAEIDDAKLTASVGDIIDLQWWVENESFVDRLKAMPEKERREEIDELLNRANYDILNSDEVNSAIADTNASGFDIDDVQISQIKFDDENRICIVDFTFEVTGEQEDEKPDTGSTIKGSGEAWIERSGELTIDHVSATVDRTGYYDEDDEYDPGDVPFDEPS